MCLAMLQATFAFAVDYVCVKNGSFRKSANSQDPLYLIGLNYPTAVTSIVKLDHLSDGVVKRNIELLHAEGINLVRFDFPLIMSVERKQTDEVKAYNDSLLVGLGLVLSELEKKGMYAIIHLNFSAQNNSSVSSYCVDNYLKLLKQTIESKKGLKRKTTAISNAIFAWEIADFYELGVETENRVEDYTKTVTTIKNVDPNHLVSVSCNSECMSEADLLQFEALLSISNVDYLNMRLLPLEWKWSNTSSLYMTLPNVYIKAKAYFESYLRMSQRLNKPLILSNVRYPRDRNHFEPHSPVDARNSCYNFIMNEFKQGKENTSPFSIAIFGDFTDETENHVPMAIYGSDKTTFKILVNKLIQNK